MGILWLKSAGEPVEREELMRFGGTGIVGDNGEKAKSGGEREIQLLEANSDFGSEDGPRGGAEDADVMRLVSLEELFVDGNDVVNRGGEGIFGSEAVVDGNDLYFG